MNINASEFFNNKHSIVWAIPIYNKKECPYDCCSHSKPLKSVRLKTFWMQKNGLFHLSFGSYYVCPECFSFFMTDSSIKKFWHKLSDLFNCSIILNTKEINSYYYFNGIFLLSQKPIWNGLKKINGSEFDSLVENYDFTGNLPNPPLTIDLIKNGYMYYLDVIGTNWPQKQQIMRLKQQIHTKDLRGVIHQLSWDIYVNLCVAVYKAAKRMPVSPSVISCISKFLSVFFPDISITKSEYKDFCTKVWLNLRNRNIDTILTFDEFSNCILSLLLSSEILKYRKPSRWLTYYSKYSQDSSYIYMIVQNRDFSIKEYIISNKYSLSSITNNDETISINSPQILDIFKEIKAAEDGKVSTILHFHCVPSFTNFIPVELFIKSNGGFFSTNPNYEIVKLLLYAPYQEKYIPINATYDRQTQECFIDIKIYREFIREHGNPDIDLSAWEDNNTNYTRKRAEQSFYKIYGYHAGSGNNELSEQTRQGYLAEIMDLKLRTPQAIIDYLDDCIRMHPNDKDYFARDKWETDRSFVSNYKVNPSRFLIAPDYIKNKG